MKEESQPPVASFIARLRDRLQSIRASGFIKSVGLLVFSSVLAQAIGFAALLIAARLYTPEDFKLLSVLGGLGMAIGVVATLRFDIAVPIPEKDEDAAGLALVAFATTVLTAALIAVPVVLAPQWLAVDLLHQPALTPLMWLLPLGVFTAGAFGTLQMWAVRAHRFKAISGVRVAQAGLAGGAQVGLGLFGISPLGLLVGPIVNSGAGFGILAYEMGRSQLVLARRVRRERIRELLREYRAYPLVSTPEAGFNVASVYVPMLIIAAVASGPDAGYLLLAMTVMQAPIGLLANAVSQVYISRAATAQRDGALPQLTADVLGGLFKSGVGPLLFAGLVAPPTFGLAFGSNWVRSGELASWMTPWIVMQFLAVPLGMAYYATGRQVSSLVIQGAGAVARVGLVLLAWAIDTSYVAEAFAISGAIYYAGYMYGVADCTCLKLHVFYRTARAASPIIMIWLVAGILLRWGLDGLH